MHTTSLWYTYTGPWVRAVGLGCLLLVSGAAPLWAALAAQYRLTDLGPYEAATIEKSSKRVLGFQHGPDGPRAVQLAPTFSDLGAFRPYGVRDVTVVGDAPVGDTTHAVRMTLDGDGTLTDLGALAGVPGHSAARCVNQDGDVAGFVDDARLDASPVVWVGGETHLDLPTWTPTLGGHALSCNDRGDAAGYAHVASGEPHCTFWGIDGSRVDCHPQSGMVWSLNAAMTSTGMLVGNAGPRLGIYGYVWMWSGLHWLLPVEGERYTRVLSINERGDSVGQSYVYDPDADSPAQAVGWDSHGVIPLRERTLNADGWTFVAARGIANDGTILVHGLLGDQVHTALLTPVETAAAAYDTWRYAIWQYYVPQVQGVVAPGDDF